jgi:hypothetical protein
MKWKNHQKKLEKRVKAWEGIRDKGGRGGGPAYHKPGSNKK